MSKSKNAVKKTTNHVLDKGKDSVTTAGKDDSRTVEGDAMEKGLEKTKPSSEEPRKLDIIHAPEDIAKDKDSGKKLAHHALEEGKKSLSQRTMVKQQKQMQKEK
eukprot:5551349-Ditylum_brightwellii.AAC.1